MLITTSLLDKLMEHAVDSNRLQSLGWLELYVLGKAILDKKSFSEMTNYVKNTEIYLTNIYKDGV